MTLKANRNIDGMVVNTKVIANLFGLTDRRVRQLVEEEIIDKVGNGRYDLQDTLKKYIAFLRANNAADHDSNKTKESLEYEKYLHERAKREMAEMELAQLKGQLHHSSEVEKVMTKMLSDFRARLLGLPTKLAPQLIARSEIQIIQDLMQKELYESLQELSDYEPSMFGVATASDNENEGDEEDE